MPAGTYFVIADAAPAGGRRRAGVLPRAARARAAWSGCRCRCSTTTPRRPARWCASRSASGTRCCTRPSPGSPPSPPADGRVGTHVPPLRTAPPLHPRVGRRGLSTRAAVRSPPSTGRRSGLSPPTPAASVGGMKPLLPLALSFPSSRRRSCCRRDPPRGPPSARTPLGSACDRPPRAAPLAAGAPLGVPVRTRPVFLRPPGLARREACPSTASPPPAAGGRGRWRPGPRSAAGSCHRRTPGRPVTGAWTWPRPSGNRCWPPVPGRCPSPAWWRAGAWSPSGTREACAPPTSRWTGARRSARPCAAATASAPSRRLRATVSPWRACTGVPSRGDTYRDPLALLDPGHPVLLPLR